MMRSIKFIGLQLLQVVLPLTATSDANVVGNTVTQTISDLQRPHQQRLRVTLVEVGIMTL